MNATPYHILLASNSPRRRELLAMIQDNFSIAKLHEIDESYPAELAKAEIPVYLSKLKSESYKDQLQPNELMLTADTVVINNGKVLGKPHNRTEAIEMLRSLMGHSHHVVTGVTLATTEKSVSFSETTEVTFGELPLSEIEQYVDNYHPYDKAGAYGIQEWVGGAGIVGINGCFYNVMGLPLHALYRHLQSF